MFVSVLMNFTFEKIMLAILIIGTLIFMYLVGLVNQRQQSYQFIIIAANNTYHCNQIESTGYPVILVDCFEGDVLKLYNPTNLIIK